jgi:hypothetical protein
MNKYYMSHIEKDKYMNDSLCTLVKCQAINGLIFWGYFVNLKYMSPKKVVA